MFLHERLFSTLSGQSLILPSLRRVAIQSVFQSIHDQKDDICFDLSEASSSFMGWKTPNVRVFKPESPRDSHIIRVIKAARPRIVVERDSAVVFPLFTVRLDPLVVADR